MSVQLTRPNVDVNMTLVLDATNGTRENMTWNASVMLKTARRDCKRQTLQGSASSQMKNTHLESCLLNVILVLNRVIIYLDHSFLPY